MGFGVWGLGLGVWGLGFGVWGLNPKPQTPSEIQNHFDKIINSFSNQLMDNSNP